MYRSTVHLSYLGLLSFLSPKFLLPYLLHPISALCPPLSPSLSSPSLPILLLLFLYISLHHLPSSTQLKLHSPLPLPSLLLLGFPTPDFPPTSIINYSYTLKASFREPINSNSAFVAWSLLPLRLSCALAFPHTHTHTHTHCIIVKFLTYCSTLRYHKVDGDVSLDKIF